MPIPETLHAADFACAWFLIFPKVKVGASTANGRVFRRGKMICRKLRLSERTLGNSLPIRVVRLRDRTHGAEPMGAVAALYDDVELAQLRSSIILEERRYR